MWREFNLINSFTLETTFCGPTDGRYQDCHFTISILKEAGKLFCKTLLDYASNEPKVREAIRELETVFPPPKAEEGLSQHFLQSDDLNQGGRGRQNGYENEDSAAMASGNEDGKKKGGKKKKGGSKVDKNNDAGTHSYSSENVNVGKYEEAKKNGKGEGKAG